MHPNELMNPLFVCLACICSSLYVVVVRVSILRRLPTNLVSRTWGRIQDTRLPRWLRKPLLASYVHVFGCDLNDVEERDLRNYETVNAFFMRKLRAGTRPIDEQSDIVSPCDGTFLHCGVVAKTGELEQVKGIRYSLSDFLGEDVRERLSDLAPHSSDHELFHCVIYLSPGDYHHFHAPTELEVTERRHFPGSLISTAPFVVRLIKGLFSFNERVALLGQWTHGFFAYTAVGALNVGSIHLPFDDELKTNAFRRNGNANEKFDRRAYDDEPRVFCRGDYMGGFAQGSTIVLLFTAPSSFEFVPKPGKHVKVGESLGRVESKAG
ncbi:phosphatidylserine decarboxylase proenzyme, mitochondrial-like isoform X2 [Oscarella lobularis]|uniref:phosphatidylserine decarboxylase proenzyme, mitochondrial-like isoform X2 n=1 Tax=Oscarella lobularis TaxID=121494 RepID=UPI0033134A54